MGNNSYGGFDLSNKLNEVRNNVLIITSDKDYICDPDVSKIMHNEIKNSEFHIIQNAGHYPFFDNQAETLHIIRNFLNKHTM